VSGRTKKGKEKNKLDFRKNELYALLVEVFSRDGTQESAICAEVGYHFRSMARGNLPEIIWFVHYLLDTHIFMIFIGTEGGGGGEFGPRQVFLKSSP
jgi:hypothetical protein